VQSIVILGSKGSGKKTLKEKTEKHLSDFNLLIYSGNLFSSYDAAILVVGLDDGPMPETREHLLAAHNTNIPNIFCFLNKVDLLEDKELHDLVNMECQELGKKYGYSNENFFIISGSALHNKNIDALIQQIRSEINKPYIPFNFKLPEYTCKRCKHIEHIPFDICKVCNTKQKTSFLKKFFGGS
jgi:translation initiation factor 2 gamma subunit (eIF-2gamma)